MSRHINKPQSALLLGAGYVARALAPQLINEGWNVHVTTRSGQTALENVICHKFNGSASKHLQSAFFNADIIVSSIPPEKDGTDPVLATLGHLSPKAKWIAYLSATSVYGDREGQWAFEGEAPSPKLSRGIAAPTQNLRGLKRSGLSIFSGSRAFTALAARLLINFVRGQPEQL